MLVELCRKIIDDAYEINFGELLGTPLMDN